jgi:hypothetical protein
MNTIQSIGKRTRQEGWTSHQRIGAIAQDFANINSGIEHDYVSNTLKGGNESHSVATLSGMSHALAQKVKDAWCDEEIEPAASADNFSGVTVVRQNSILDNLPLAEEHLVFKFSSIDPGVKCSEIVVTVNVKKVTSGIITLVMIALRDLLPMVGLVVGMAMSDAAGCNWASYCDTLSMHTFWDALPQEMIVKYPTVDFNVKCLMMDPVTLQWVVFLPNMCHLTTNIATSLELSSSKNLKCNLMYGRVPVNMGMV